MTITCFHDNYILFEIASGIHFSSDLLMLTHMGMKFGTHACYFMSMTTTSFHDNHISRKTTNSFRNLPSLLKLANGSTHGDETCMHAYDIVSMTTTYYLINNTDLLLLYSSKLLTPAVVEMKLGTCAYYNISTMTTAIFSITGGLPLS